MSKEGDAVREKKLILQPKAPKGVDGYRTFSVRIREETVERLDELALRADRSRNELVGTFLDYAIENCEIAEKPSDES